MLSLLCPKRRTHRSIGGCCTYVCLYVCVCLCGCSGAHCRMFIYRRLQRTGRRSRPGQAEERMHNFLQRRSPGWTGSRASGRKEGSTAGRREVSDESDHDTIYWSLMRNKWTCHRSSRSAALLLLLSPPFVSRRSKGTGVWLSKMHINRGTTTYSNNEVAIDEFLPWRTTMG